MSQQTALLTAINYWSGPKSGCFERLRDESSEAHKENYKFGPRSQKEHLKDL